MRVGMNYCCRVQIIARSTLLVAAVALFTTNLIAVETPWATLKYKTAWVLLGMWDVNTRTWGTVTHHLLKSGSASGSTSVPKVGDTIEITQDSPLAIANYATEGERGRLVSMADRVG